MQKALVVKELRESAGIVALALLGGVYALAEFTGTRMLPWQGTRLDQFPFVNDSLQFYFWLVTAGLAIAIAFRQTAWELGTGTYFFLLHRPISRACVFTYKLVVGFVLVMLLSAMLILTYVWWVATPGHIAVPFFWSMTCEVWQAWIMLPLIYFGAFMAGIRPGRWFGSRLIPLLAAIAVAIIGVALPWIWATLAISLVASAFLLVGIYYHVAHRDY